MLSDTGDNNKDSLFQFNKIPFVLNKKKLMIMISSAAAVFLVVIIIIITSCANSSLEAKLTNHTWTKTGQYERYLQFYKNGTYTIELDTGTIKEGTWSINDNVLKMTGLAGSGEFKWYDNVMDRDFELGLVGSEYYTWYVSDNYFSVC